MNRKNGPPNNKIYQEMHTYVHTLCFLWYFSICNNNKNNLWKDFKTVGRMRTDTVTSGIWVKCCCKACQFPSVFSCLLLLQHDLTGPSQFSQFDLGILSSVQRHLTVFPGWISGTFMRLTSSYLGRRQENYCFILLLTIWYTLTDYIFTVVLDNTMLIVYGNPTMKLNLFL